MRRIRDIDGAAEYLATSPRHVRRLVQERRVAFHRLGRKLRFDERDLDALLDAGRVESRDVTSSRKREAVRRVQPADRIRARNERRRE